MNWELCDVSNADREFLFELHRLALGPYIAETWGWDENWQRDHFDRAFPTANWKLLVVDGCRVGAVRTSDTDGELYLEDILILPGFQRRGLGSAVILSLLGEAASSGRTVGLQVLKVNPAIHLYARLGFVVIGEDDVHVRMRSSPANAPLRC